MLLADAAFDFLGAGALGDGALQALFDDHHVGVHVVSLQGLLVEALAEAADGVDHHAASGLLGNDDKSTEGDFVGRDHLLVRAKRHSCHHLRRREAEREVEQLACTRVRVEVGDLLGLEEECRLDVVLHDSVATLDVDIEDTRFSVPEVLAFALADALRQLVGAVVVRDLAGLESLGAVVDFEGDFHPGLECPEADAREPAGDLRLVDEVAVAVVALDVAVAVDVAEHTDGAAQTEALLGLVCLRALGGFRGLRDEPSGGRIRREGALEGVHHAGLDGCGGCDVGH